MPRRRKENGNTAEKPKQVQPDGVSIRRYSGSVDDCNSIDCGDALSGISAKSAAIISKMEEKNRALESALREANLRLKEIDLGARSFKSESQPKPRISCFLEDCANQLEIENSNDHCAINPTDNLAILRNSIELPKVELTPFDGKPTSYWKFVKQFEYYIEAKVPDDGQRLLYLLHYCHGRAKDAIEECIMLPPGEGYRRARQILKELYGETFIVARALIDDVLKESRSVGSSTEALSRLVIRMQNCQISLSQMNYLHDLNSTHTIEGVLRNLPLELQSRWAEEADRLNTNGHEPVFQDLIDFMAKRLRIARSRFGQLVERSKEVKSQQTRPAAPTSSRFLHETGTSKSSFIHVSSQNSPSILSCKLCSGDHSLTECSRFIEMEVEKRWESAKALGACFSCLKTGHRATECRKFVRCSVGGCSKRHNSLLHPSRPIDADDANHSKVVCNALNEADKFVRLGILPVKVVTPVGTVTTLALLDSGSDTTLVTEKFIKDHAIVPTPTKMSINTIGGMSRIISARVEMKLTSLAGDETLDIPQAFTIKEIPVKANNSALETARRWSHLRDIPFEEIGEEEVTILIGCDIPEAHWTLEQRISGRKQPYAVKTLLGWVLFGPSEGVQHQNRNINCLCAGGSGICEQIRALYNQEFEDNAHPGTSYSIEEKQAIDIVNKGSKLRRGHYEIPLPWKIDHAKLPNNKILAERRLQQLARRFVKDEQLYERYKVVIQHHLDKGYLEPCEQMVDFLSPNITWYVPHHAVINPKKPNKLRVVFDCAAKFNQLSLNDCLLQGPDLTSSLVTVLMRFRSKRVAMAADIEEMFLQVGVPSEQRDALRILWWDQHDFTKLPVEYRMTVHPFGAVSSPFCANFALQTTASKHGHLFTAAVKHSVFTNFYVDDYLDSFDDEHIAIQHAAELAELLAKGGFRLTKWISNSREVLQTIPEGERAKGILEFADSSLPSDRALGVQWDAQTDEFVLKFELPVKPATRRGILSSLSSLFDPLGFIAPWLLPGKVILQRLCRAHVGWDDPLSNDDHKLWQNWQHDLCSLGGVRITRCIKLDANEIADIHLFSDASEVGYGAVAYATFGNGSANCRTCLLFSKARVAPLKSISIPRLELNAAVLAVRIYQKIKESSSIAHHEVTFWTDSMIVLYYIRNTSTSFSTFVANRLSVIHDATEVHQWRHVGSDDNPADLVSRGTTGKNKLTKWINGPEFLSDQEQMKSSHPTNLKDLSDVEIKRSAIISLAVKDNPFLQALERISSWYKLLRTIAWLTRFTTYWKLMHLQGIESSVNVGRLTLKEIEDAELNLLRLVQRDVFHKELNWLSEEGERRKSRNASTLSRLNPVIIDGLLRVGGRLSNAAVPFETKHPIIIPKNHHISNLIVQHYHEIEGHSGPSHVISRIRTRFWIIQGTSLVKRIINRCSKCRRLKAAQGRQMMSSLPPVRVQLGWHPFSQVGLDYFGPFEVRQGRSNEKRYGCLFTCMQSRAVHLEVASSMSTDSFLLLLTRFIGRRGTPTDIYSDNGANFVGARTELNAWWQSIDQERISNDLLSKGINWHFNPPYSSHRGGVWERLVRSVRRIMCILVTEQSITDETLSTVFVEIERILNNRPIVPILSSDTDAMSLCPNDLLLLRGSEGIELKYSIAERYRRKWKQAQYLADVFWKRWTQEYLPTLQRRQKWTNEYRNFKPGDVVLISTENVRKNSWPLGVIVKCQVDGDGLVRTVDVRTGKGTVTRDIRKVCLLEGAD